MEKILIKNIKQLVQVWENTPLVIKNDLWKEFPILENAWLAIENGIIADFGSIKEGDKITVRVIGQRFELNDKFISIIGEFVKEKPDYKKLKKGETKARLVFEE